MHEALHVLKIVGEVAGGIVAVIVVLAIVCIVALANSKGNPFQ
jgi:hypothetical protein